MCKDVINLFLSVDMVYQKNFIKHLGQIFINSTLLDLECSTNNPANRGYLLFWAKSSKIKRKHGSLKI